LADSLRALDADELLKETLGPEMYAAFWRAKWSEVQEYRSHVMDWEVQRYLELA
jgi:glutamine synthetase